MKKVLIALSLLMLSAVFLAPSAKADGGIFFPENHYVAETAQTAFIYFRDGNEELVIKPSYQGDAVDFVWVVPTPGEPKVSASSQSLFVELQKLSTSDQRVYPASELTLGTADVAQKNEVTVLEEKTIDAYETVTLKASSQTALADWMKERDYTFPQTKNYLLGDYVNAGWYFVLVKIRPEAADDATTSLQNGTITPLRLSFKSDKIIYPMKLTKIALEQEPITTSSTKRYSYYNYTDLTIYTLTDYRVTNSQLTTTFAGWIKPAKIEGLLAQSSESNWINSDKKLFLTKMYKSSYSVQNMTDDLVLAKNKDNDRYPEPFYSTYYYWQSFFGYFAGGLVALVLSPLVLLFVIISLMQKYNERWRNLGLWLKTILLLAAPAVILYFLILPDYYHSNPLYLEILENGETAGLLMALLIVEIVLIVLTILGYRKIKKGPLAEAVAA